jgi:hypothetical protein
MRSCVTPLDAVEGLAAWPLMDASDRRRVSMVWSCARIDSSSEMIARRSDDGGLPMEYAIPRDERGVNAG